MGWPVTTAWQGNLFPFESTWGSHILKGLTALERIGFKSRRLFWRRYIIYTLYIFLCVCIIYINLQKADDLQGRNCMRNTAIPHLLRCSRQSLKSKTRDQAINCIFHRSVLSVVTKSSGIIKDVLPKASPIPTLPSTFSWLLHYATETWRHHLRRFKAM